MMAAIAINYLGKLAQADIRLAYISATISPKMIGAYIVFSVPFFNS
jgi:hypothetical protein